MLAEITNHLWQSTIFACAVALLAPAFRKNRAQVRYWLWLTASLKFLIPFALLINLGSAAWDALATQKIAPQITAPAISLTVEQIAQPFSDTQSFISVAPNAPLNWPLIAIFAVWASGFAAVVITRLRGWLRVRAAIKNSLPIDIAAPMGVRSSPALLEPGVVGLFHPTLLLPEGIVQNLTPPQLEAVLAHELAHIRRRDNLTAALHMLVEATFWFHPAIWWIGARLVEERERACDETVLTLGSQPRDYAEAILNVCKLYIESPVVCVSGITGSDIKRRIERIAKSQIGESLTRQRKVVLACAGIAVLTLPVLAGVVALPSLRAQSTASPVPKWDVISIKPCDAGSNGSSGGGFQPGAAPAGFSPTRMTLNCQPAIRFIQDAYLLFPDAQAPPNRNFAMLTPIEGAPDWVKKERYMIEAKSGDSATPEMMEGPMLQALLEDRFKLTLHHETREVPVYDLVVAKGGPKLTPFVEGSCVPWQPPDIVTGPPTPRPQLPPGQKYCLRAGGTGSANGTFLTNLVIDDDGTTLDSLCKDLFNSVGGDGRRVINKTGLTGRYSIHLEYTISEAARNELTARGIVIADPTFPEIFTALQEQLGLKLAPGKGPGDFIVIDHIEQPAPN